MMPAWQRRTFNAVSAVVAVSGFLYLWMKYLLVSDDPLAVVNHPLQPWVLDLHVLSGPALLVMFGIIYSAHVAVNLARRVQPRRSGIASLVTFATMALSGYLLQVVVNETAHLLAVWLHIGSGVVFAGSYAAHVVTSIRQRYRNGAWAGVPSP
jgi:hypothetical protein